MIDPNKIKEAVKIIGESSYTFAFTGAGISVESGIPPFRGENGIWGKYDPKVLELGYFHENPEESWKVIREIFYEYFGKSLPNKAHKVLAEVEKGNLLQSIVTQNIDNLHQEAGSREVYEFHGNMKKLLCTSCGKYHDVLKINLEKLPPQCSNCNGLLKPDFIFFGEGIPPDAYQKSMEAAQKAEVILIIGTTGEVMPAAQIPYIAKQNGAKVIEVNTKPSNYSGSITDIYLEGKATEVMGELMDAILVK
jgi:NAD-dependent deacetylase